MLSGKLQWFVDKQANVSITNYDRQLQISSKENSSESEATHPTVCWPGFLPVSHFKKLDFFFLSFQPFFGLINDS